MGAERHERLKMTVRGDGGGMEKAVPFEHPQSKGRSRMGGDIRMSFPDFNCTSISIV